MLNKESTIELMKYLEDSQQIELIKVDDNDKILKAVVTDDFTLITLCDIEKPNRRIRNCTDFKLLYCSSSKYTLSPESYTFRINKDYEKVGFYTIPKNIFPEYFL